MTSTFFKKLWDEVEAKLKQWRDEFESASKAQLESVVNKVEDEISTARNGFDETAHQFEASVAELRAKVTELENKLTQSILQKVGQ